VENRFMEMDLEFRAIGRNGGRQKQPHALAASWGGRSSGWESSFSAAQRALVILIENGGVDLGIPDLADKLLSVLPGTSLLPDGVRQKIIEFLRTRIKGATDSLLETAELAANRYTAAKPEFYGEVTILRDGSASYGDLKSRLISLSRAGSIIDLFILTHGNRDYISVQGGITGDKIRGIKAEYGKPLTIRAVYMMNCVGASLNQAWLDAGARVSAGARGNNYLPEPTMFFFWKNWKGGQSFESAATGAYAATVKLMNEALRGFLRELPGGAVVADAVDFSGFDFVRDSAPVIDGRRSLTITTDDLSFAESTSTGMATTVVPVSALSADGGAEGGSMTVSDAGVDFVKSCEGGYGTLVHLGGCDGRASETSYRAGVSEEDATRLLSRELANKQKAVGGAVKVALNQNQYDALVSFAYNVGAGAFQHSTLLKLLNQGKYEAVPGELKKWTKARKNGQLIDLPGLVKRRAAEAALFAKPVTASSQSLAAAALGQYGRALSQTGACGNLTIWLNAFIPRDVPSYTFTVPGGPHAGKTAIPCPGIALPANLHCLSRGYLTDQRGFDSSSAASVRMRSLVEMSLVPATLVSQSHVTSGTTEIDKDTGAVTCVQAADMSRCSFSGFRVTPDPAAPTSDNFQIILHVKGAASDPCVNLAADIDYEGDITVFCSPHGGIVEVRFDGNIDDFPAFEMYADLNGVTQQIFRVPPPPGHTVVNLLGGASNPVGGHATFQNCQLPIAAVGAAA
jgi:GH24 family phage-related lysozyme (muramidase)